MVFNATFNNISAISWRQVLLVEETGVCGENHRGFVFYDTRPSDDVGFFYRKNKTAVLYSLAKRPSHNKIPVVLIDSDSYSEQELLGQLKGAINQIKGSVSQIKIITKNTTMSDDDYKSMMKFLSKELHVSVQAYNTYTQTKPWLSINPGDSQVISFS
jgi:hypothetical protein